MNKTAKGWIILVFISFFAGIASLYSYIRYTKYNPDQFPDTVANNTMITGLSPENFISANISQWKNDAGYLSSVSFSQVKNENGQYLDYRPNNIACLDKQILQYDKSNARWICATAPAGTTATSIWGDIAGNLSSQRDLSNALNDKLSKSSQFSGDLSGTIESASVIDDSHRHTGATIIGLSPSNFLSRNVSQWTNDAGYITGLSYNQISNGTAIYLDYRPNNSACTNGQVLKYDQPNSRWICGADAGGSTIVWGGIQGDITNQTDLQTALSGKLTTTTTFGGNVSGTYNNLSVTGLTPSNFVTNTISQWSNDAGYLTTVNYADITNAPNTYMNYRPGGIACNQNQILSYDTATQRWICATLPNQLTESQIEGYITNGPVSLASGTTLNGASLATQQWITGQGYLTLESDPSLTAWQGSTNIIRVGILTAGTWHGTPIDSLYIQDGTIQFTDIGNNGCTDGQTMVWNTSQNKWVCSATSSGETAWGSISGSLTAQADLVTALGNKIDATVNFGGDVTGVFGNISVTNNSHNHTGITISELSVSNFSSSNISQWANDAGYLTALDYSQLSNGSGVFMNYQPNGIACTNGQILVYDAPNQQWVCGDNSSGSGNNATQYIQLRDEKPQGTDGGSFPANTWVTRILNTKAVDETNQVILSSNQFSLPAGTYTVKIVVPATMVGRHKARLRNITAGTTQIEGTSEFNRSGGTYYASTSSLIQGKFTLTTTTIFEVQHFNNGGNTVNGLGMGVGSGPEIYTVVELWKETFSAGSTAATWGNISGNIADQTDLSNTLSNKIDATATFSGDVSGTYNALTIENDSHNHTGTTISGLAPTNFASSTISQWANDAGYITGLDFSQISNGAGIYLNYRPNGIPCSDGQILQYETVNQRWICGTMNTTTGMAIGNSVTSGSPGSLLYISNSGSLAQDSNRLHWDAINSRLGIGTNSPNASVDIKGSLRLSGDTAGSIQLSAPVNGGNTSYILPSSDGIAGQVLTTDGAGNLSWATYSGSGVSGGGSDYIIIRDEKPSGTSGGTFIPSTWQTRILNTEVADAGNHATLNNNQITLQPGTYTVRASAPGYYVNQHKIRLQNITDGATVLVGTAEYSGQGGNGIQTRSEITGTFTLNATKTLEIQHYGAATAGSQGLGVQLSNGSPEIYTTVEFWYQKEVGASTPTALTGTEVTGSRAYETNYQNTTGKSLVVTWIVAHSNVGTSWCNVDSFVPPTTTTSEQSGGAGWVVTMVFIVPPNHYYRCTSNLGGGASVYKAFEYTLDGSGTLTEEQVETFITNNPISLAAESTIEGSLIATQTWITGQNYLTTETDPTLIAWQGSSNITRLGIVTTGTWHGDPITSDYIQDGTIQFSDLGQNGCTDGQVMQWNSTLSQWSCGTVATGTGSMTIGSTISGATEGSLLFAGASGALSQAATTLFWDTTNSRLGIGTNAPQHTLDINGNLGIKASGYINFGNSTGDAGYGIRDNNGTIEIKNSGGNWQAVGTGSSPGETTTTSIYSRWDPDAPPATASSYDDEFSDGILDASWTVHDANTVLEANGGVKLTDPQYISKAIPNGDFSAWTKLSVSGQPGFSQYSYTYLTAQAGTGTIYTVGFTQKNGSNSIEIVRWNSYPLSWNSTPVVIGVDSRNELYVSIRRSGSTVTFWVSQDGIAYNRIYAVSDYGITRLGLMNVGEGANAFGYFDFFRYTSTAYNQSWIPEGRLVPVGGGGSLQIGDPVAGVTTGSILFASSGGLLAQNNTKLFWNEGNNRLGIGTNNPQHTLDVSGNIGIVGSGYINFGPTDGNLGYGLRDNNGSIEYKDNGGNWKSIESAQGAPSWAINPDQPPTTPNAMDDEFNSISVDPKWTVYTDVAGQQSITTANNLLELKYTSTAPNTGRYVSLLQPAPAGTWKFRTKMTLEGIMWSYTGGGVIVRNPSTNKNLWFSFLKHTSYGDGPTGYVGRFVGSAISSEVDLANAWDHTYYIEIEYTGTHLNYKVSTSGVSYQTVYSEAITTFLGGPPEYVGVMLHPYSTAGGYTPQITFDWFRRIN